MPTDATIQILREAGSRREADFDQWIESLDGLRTQISCTPVPAQRQLPKLASRRRTVGLSLAAAVLAAAVAAAVGMTLTASAPPAAYAAAKKALTATAAAASGTMTGSVSQDGSSYTLDTTQWNGNAIEMTRGDRSQLGPFQALMLSGGGAYVEQADGTWLHYARTSGVGPKLGPMVELAQNNVAGNTASQILSLATGLTQTTQPDGTTLYTGTIPNSNADSGTNPNDDAILRIITNLSNGPDNTPDAPGGYHNGLRLRMTVGTDGFVQQVSLTYQQQGTGSTADNPPITWTVRYNKLGSTPPITPPATSILTPPVIWSPGPACTAPCGP
jgi:hypothetical protein